MPPLTQAKNNTIITDETAQELVAAFSRMAASIASIRDIRNRTPADEFFFVDIVYQSSQSVLAPGGIPVQVDKPFKCESIVYSFLPATAAATLTVGKRSIPITNTTKLPDTVNGPFVVRPADIIQLSVVAGTYCYVELFGVMLDGDKWRVLE